MHLSQLATFIAIGLLFVGTYCSAEDRSASSSQRYRIHVAREVRFGPLEPPVASEQAAASTKEDAESLSFMAETTSGLTIQFEVESELTQKLPLQVTVGGSKRGSWWANNSDGTSESTREKVAEGTNVQASTHKAGWTMLKIDTASPSAATDETITTIVVTIVPH